MPKVACRDCGTLRQVHVLFARPMHRCIRAFERYILQLLNYMTCKDVAELLGVSWGTIRDIEKDHLFRRYAKPPLKDIKHIAIDEIAMKKGPKYMPAVLNLDAKQVTLVGE